MKKIRLLFLTLVALMGGVTASYADDTWTVAGTENLTGSNWDTEAISNDMTLVEGTCFYTLTKKDVSLNTTGEFKFKIVKNHAWDEAYPSSDYVLNVDADGTYDVTFFFNSDTKEVFAAYTFSIQGNIWDSWATDKEMTQDPNNPLVYTLVIPEFEANATTYEYKLHANKAWSYQIPSGSSNKSWTPETAGKYKLTFTFNYANSSLDLVAEDLTEHTYVVAGVPALLGASWATASEANKMTKDGDVFKLTKENVMLLAGDYEYKISKDATTWIPDGENKKLTIEENGYYNVTFTYAPANNGEITATAVKTQAIGYAVDFNTAISTSVHDFAIASNWKHIVGTTNNDGYGPYYMSYQYKSDEGIDKGALLAWGQTGSGDNTTSELTDILVTPLLSGAVKMYVKPSGLANTSNPSYIEIYKINSVGTEKGDLIQRFTVDNGYENSGIEGWYTVSLNLDEEQRIGIRAQHAYLENFIATSATIVAEPKLTITNVKSATSGTYYVDKKEDGSVDVTLVVSLQNSGDVDLVAGETANYTLTPVKVAYYGSTETPFESITFPIPENIAKGETKDITMTVNIPDMETGWLYWKVRENISSTTSSAKVQSQVKEYAPVFVFREAGSTSSSSRDIAFGKITEQTSKSYEVYNDGNAPLVVKSITVPEGFTVDNEGNFTVAAKEKQTITITLPVTTPGIFSGNLEVVYVDKTGADATYTKGVTGTVLDATKNIITFDDGAGNAYYPQGSVRYNAYISSEGSGDSKNYYLLGSTPNPLYITPLMTAEAGESIAFDAMYSSYSGNKVEVMISTDRQNWTTIQTVSDIASQYNWTTYTATIPEAGNYYLGFKLTSSKIDNIYGLVYATAPAHDLLLVGEDVPATATQNVDYTATVKVGNVGPNVEAAGAYTASLYVDGKEVATANNVDLPVAVISGNYNNGEEGNYKVLSFTYKPHTPGTFPAYIEVKAGDVVLKTSEVSLVIAEEKTESDLSQETNGTTNTGLLHMNWNNSESVSLYSKTVLANMGLVNGDKISSITFKGYNTGSKNYSTTLNVWYEFTTDETQASPSAGKYDTSEMTNALSIERSWANVEGSSSNLVDLITINFETPITYDSNKGLRIVVCSEGTQYQSGTYFENSKQSGNQTSYYNRNDTYSTFESTQTWSPNSYLPAIHLGLMVEPTTLAGTVTDANGVVEGATVTIRNAENDIEYSATTAADGSYTINVIQNDKAYKAVADKDGLVSDVKDVASFADAVDFTLAAPEYGEIDATASAGYFKYLAQEDDKLEVTYTENPTVDRVVKFTKPSDWSAVYVYAWDGNDAAVTSAWHGNELSVSYYNEYNQPVYSYDVPENAVGIIFNDGGSNQTSNITDFTVTGYYFDNGELKSWTDNNTAIQLCDDKGAVVADATLDNGTATVELTDAIIAKLAAGLYVTVKGTEANITKVELQKDDSYILAEDATGVTAGTYAKVKIKREFKAGWNAICLPFYVSPDEVNAAFGADCEMAVYDGDTGGEDVTVKFKKVDAGQYRYMTASYPYLIWLENPVSGVKFLNKTIESETPGAADEGANAFEYVGVYAKTLVNGGDYFVKGGKFVKATTNNNVLPFRAYLKLKSSGARSVTFVIGDQTTTQMIEGLVIEDQKNVEGVYNMQGQKVQNMNRKGLYIINGKKVMVK